MANYDELFAEISQPTATVFDEIRKTKAGEPSSLIRSQPIGGDYYQASQEAVTAKTITEAVARERLKAKGVAELPAETADYDNLFDEISQPVPTPEEETSNILSELKKAFSRGEKDRIVNEMYAQEMEGSRPKGEALAFKRKLEKLEREDPVEANNFLTKGLTGFARMTPMLLKGIYEGQKYGMGGAGAGATAALVAGQAGPQIVTPEEVVTVPVAAATGYALGQGFGQTNYWRRQGAAEVFSELTEKGVDAKTARLIGEAAGVPYALIEQAQFLRAVPGFKNLKNLFTKSLIRNALRLAKERGIDVAEQTLQEGLQKVITETGVEIADYIEGTKGTKDVKDSAKNVLKQGVQEMKDVLPTMTVMLGPKTLTQAAATPYMTKQIQKEEQGKTEEGVKPKITPEEPEAFGKAALEDVLKEPTAGELEKVEDVYKGEEGPVIDEGVEKVEEKVEPSVPPEIVDPVKAIDAEMQVAETDRERRLLQEKKENVVDDLFNEPGAMAYSNKEGQKSLKKLDEANIPYTYGRIDIEGMNTANTHYGSHGEADVAMRKIIGQNVIKDIVDAGGIVFKGGKADEVKFAIPNMSVEDVNALMERAQDKGVEARDREGIGGLTHQKYNIKNYGALDITYAVVEGQPGKYGEMDREADKWEGFMKARKLDIAGKKYRLRGRELNNVVRSIIRKARAVGKFDPEAINRALGEGQFGPEATEGRPGTPQRVSGKKPTRKGLSLTQRETASVSKQMFQEGRFADEANTERVKAEELFTKFRNRKFTVGGVEHTIYRSGTKIEVRPDNAPSYKIELDDEVWTDPVERIEKPQKETEIEKKPKKPISEDEVPFAKEPPKPSEKAVEAPTKAKPPKVEPKPPAPAAKPSEALKQTPITKEAVKEEFSRQIKAVHKKARGKIRDVRVSEYHVIRNKQGKPMRTGNLEQEGALAHIDESPTGDVTITISPRVSQEDLAWAISHEIGHFGLARVIRSRPKLGKQLDTLYKIDKDTDFVKKLRETYRNVSEDAFLEEWALARLGQMGNLDQLSKREQGIVKNLVRIVKEFYAEIQAKLKGEARSPNMDKVLRGLVREMGKERIAKVSKGAKEVQRFAKKPPKGYTSLEVEHAKDQPKTAPIPKLTPQQKAEKRIFDEQGKVTEKTFDRMVRMIQDRFYRLKVLQTAKTGDKLSEKENAYLQQEIMHSKAEAALDALMSDHIKPLEKKLQASGLTLDEFESYLYAKHARERNETIRERDPKNDAGSGMTDADADAILKEFDNLKLTKTLENLAQHVYDMNDRALSKKLEAGLLSKDQVKGFKKWKYYVPLRGIGEPETDKVAARQKGRGFDIRGKQITAALGRRTKAHNLLANTLAQANLAIVDSNRNKVAQAFLNFVKNNPDENLWTVDKPITKRRLNKSTGEVETYETAAPFTLEDIQKHGHPMRVKVNGEESVILIKDPALAKAMLNLDADKSGKLLHTLATANRWLAMVNTSLVPEFMLANFTRDLQTAMVNMGGEYSASTAKDIGKKIFPAMRGTWQAMHGKTDTEYAKWYNEFVNAGGKVGFFAMKNVETIQKDLMREVSVLKGGKKAVAIKTYRAVMGTVNDLNAAVENATRLATYITMREQGLSKSKAASVAKNVTVNFNRKGEMGGLVNGLYLFANASIQGTARIFKALGNPRVQKIVGGIALGSFSLAQYNRWAGGKDDDDEDYYDKIPNWIKQNNIVIMWPGSKGAYVRVPVPYGYNIFYAAGQAADVAIKQKKPLEGAMMVAGAFGDAFNPLGVAPTAIQTFTPSQARWLVDLSINKNFFGAPIKKEQKYGPEMAQSFLAFKRTSELSKKIAQSITTMLGGGKYEPALAGTPFEDIANLSPDQMDYVFKYATGGMGRTFGQLIDIGAKLGTGKASRIQSNKIPFVRRFYGKVDTYQDTQEMWKRLDKIEMKRAQYEHLKQTDIPRAYEYYSKNKPILLFTEKVNNPKTGRKILRINQKLKRFYDLREQREKFDSLGDAKTVDYLDKEINGFVKRFNAEYDYMVKGGGS